MRRKNLRSGCKERAEQALAYINDQERDWPYWTDSPFRCEGKHGSSWMRLRHPECWIPMHGPSNLILDLVVGDAMVFDVDGELTKNSSSRFCIKRIIARDKVNVQSVAIAMSNAMDEADLYFDYAPHFYSMAGLYHSIINALGDGKYNSQRCQLSDNTGIVRRVYLFPFVDPANCSQHGAFNCENFIDSKLRYLISEYMGRQKFQYHDCGITSSSLAQIFYRPVAQFNPVKGRSPWKPLDFRMMIECKGQLNSFIDEKLQEMLYSNEELKKKVAYHRLVGRTLDGR